MSDAVMPRRPPAPPPRTQFDLFGLDNGLWRLSFLASYFALCAVSARSCSGIGLGQLFAMHLIWFCGSCFFAREVNALVCDCLSEDETAKHKVAVWKLEQEQPVHRFERDKESDEWVDKRLPLLDDRMGSQLRP